MGKNIKYAFRVVHIDNLPHLLKYGFVHKDSPNAANNYVPIGDPLIIEKRIHQLLNNQHSIGDLIPFYFGPRSPMLYVIQHGYNGVRQFNAEELVYCIIRIDDIIINNINCIFTDGHALNYITNFYGKEKLKELNNIIKYDDVYTGNWVNEDDRDLKRRKEAELLVLDELSSDFIRGFVVYNEKAYNNLLAMGINANKIAIRPNYYF